MEDCPAKEGGVRKESGEVKMCGCSSRSEPRTAASVSEGVRGGGACVAAAAAAAVDDDGGGT